MQEGIQNLPQLKERKSEVNNLLVTIVTDMQEKQVRVTPLRQKLSAASSEKSQLKEKNRVKVNQMQKKLDAYRRMDHDING